MLSRERADATVALTAAGVTVLIDGTAGRLPAVVHWGHELSDLDAGQADALVGGSVPVVGSNNAALAPRVAVLPEHHTGWTGRPGLRGSFAGRDWSPAFTTHSIALNGNAISGFASTGPGVVEVVADDDTGRLRLHIALELRPSGLIRSRASVTNLAAEAYTVDEVVLSFPVPGEANELLDFAGQPQPGTGAAARAVPHRRPRTGEPQGPHRRGQRLPPARRHRRGSASATAASGRCTRPGAATTSTTPSGSSPANSSSAAASCCCPERCGSRPARATRARGSTGRTASAWTRSPSASTGTCVAANRRSRPTAR